jgi:hypothetical protein
LIDMEQRKGRLAAVGDSHVGANSAPERLAREPWELRRIDCRREVQLEDKLPDDHARSRAMISQNPNGVLGA